MAVQTFTRMYDDHDDAMHVVQALEQAGVPHADVSLVASNADTRYGANGGTGGTSTGGTGTGGTSTGLTSGDPAQGASTGGGAGASSSSSRSSNGFSCRKVSIS